jgi:protein phosphatase
VLVAAIERANTLVLEAAPEGGTTLTAALIMGNNAYIAHVGDTRAYFINNDGIKQITEDHSLAQRLKDIGQATQDQITQVEHVLYRAIGQGSAIEVDTYMQHLPPGTSMLLCSDGLWKGIDDDEILKEIVNSSVTPQEACEQLVALANKNGGEDNITGVIASMGAEG